jgi:hypothetical protein
MYDVLNFIKYRHPIGFSGDPKFPIKALPASNCFNTKATTTRFDFFTKIATNRKTLVKERFSIHTTLQSFDLQLKG